ncbi:MAG: hypothetical protein AVDCRST_MAG80-2491, partial [uncultured Rubrobacteraceae bacterium]
AFVGSQGEARRSRRGRRPEVRCRGGPEFARPGEALRRWDLPDGADLHAASGGGHGRSGQL